MKKSTNNLGKRRAIIDFYTSESKLSKPDIASLYASACLGGITACYRYNVGQVRTRVWCMCGSVIIFILIITTTTIIKRLQKLLVSFFSSIILQYSRQINMNNILLFYDENNHIIHLTLA